MPGVTAARSARAARDTKSAGRRPPRSPTARPASAGPAASTPHGSRIPRWSGWVRTGTGLGTTRTAASARWTRQASRRGSTRAGPAQAVSDRRECSGATSTAARAARPTPAAGPATASSGMIRFAKSAMRLIHPLVRKGLGVGDGWVEPLSARKHRCRIALLASAVLPVLTRGSTVTCQLVLPSHAWCGRTLAHPCPRSPAAGRPRSTGCRLGYARGGSPVLFTPMSEFWAASGLAPDVIRAGRGVRRALAEAVREAVRTGHLARGDTAAILPWARHRPRPCPQHRGRRLCRPRRRRMAHRPQRLGHTRGRQDGHSADLGAPAHRSCRPPLTRPDPRWPRPRRFSSCSLAECHTPRPVRGPRRRAATATPAVGRNCGPHSRTISREPGAFTWGRN